MNKLLLVKIKIWGRDERFQATKRILVEIFYSSLQTTPG